MKSQHSVIVVPGHKISDWYDRAAERCEFVMIELGSTLTDEQRMIGLEQFAKLEVRPNLYARYDWGGDPIAGPSHVRVEEQWEGRITPAAVIVESPRGAMAAQILGTSILAGSWARFPAELWFGPMDFCASARLPWRSGRTRLELHAASLAALAAKAVGVPFVAGPCFESHRCFEEALEDFAEFGADRKGALNLDQVDCIEMAWEKVPRIKRSGSGVAWEKGVLVGPVLR